MEQASSWGLSHSFMFSSGLIARLYTILRAGLETFAYTDGAISSHEWLYLGYHFDDDSPNEALKAVTDRMTEVMLEQSPELPVKVVVLAARPSQPSQPSLP